MASIRITLAALLLATVLPAQSGRPGMGATPYPGGVTFRVWAPHADAVTVSGEFNGWNWRQHRLGAEPGGLWSIDVPGAQVGQEYRYGMKNGPLLFARRDPRARAVTSSDYDLGNSIIVDLDGFDWQGDAFVPPSVEELVLYELHAGTLRDQPGGAPGTFWTAIDALDHLEELGINAVEVMPPSEFPGDFSAGYDPAEPFAIESAYGGRLAFQTFVRECHARGIAVLLDVVHNHWGPWDLQLWQYDGWSDASYPDGIYFYDLARIDTDWGPRPNYSEPEVRSFILDQLFMWVDECRVDGFRFDSTSNIWALNHGFGQPLPDGLSLLQEANDALRAARPGLFSSAEDGTMQDWLAQPTASGGAGFDALWDFDFVTTVRAEISKPLDSQRSMSALQSVLERQVDGSWFDRVIFDESHDQAGFGGERLTSLIDPNDGASWRARKLSTLAAGLVLTSPGVPMIFQGQEILDQAAFDEAAPIWWPQKNSFRPVFDFWVDAVALRRNAGGASDGLLGDHLRVHHRDDARKVLGWHRWRQGDAAPGDDVVVVANFSGAPISGHAVGFPRPGTWTAHLNSDLRIYGADYGDFGSATVDANGPPLDLMSHSASLDLGAYSILVFSTAP